MTTSKIIALAVAQARLEEARWWINHLETHGDEVLESDRKRIAFLERELASVGVKRRMPRAIRALIGQIVVRIVRLIVSIPFTKGDNDGKSK